MKVVFFGTPEFALPSLRALVSAGYTVPLVVTRADKPAGRGKKLTPPPVKLEAQRFGIPVLQPEGKEQELLRRLKELEPDLAVVVAYGRFLPEGVLKVPRYGFVNLHPSLLPEYRGASPIQSALLDGKKTTGVTVLKVTPELDAGDILSQVRVPISRSDNAKTLSDRLAKVGAELLLNTIPRYVSGEITPVPQEHSRATYCYQIRKDMGRIDWKLPAERIFNMVRAFTPWPSAYTTFRGRRVKVVSGEPVSGDGEPGRVVSLENGILVGTGRGLFKIERLVPEGRKEMSAQDFVRGYRLSTKDLFT